CSAPATGASFRRGRTRTPRRHCSARPASAVKPTRHRRHGRSTRSRTADAADLAGAVTFPILDEPAGAEQLPGQGGFQSSLEVLGGPAEAVDEAQVHVGGHITAEDVLAPTRVESGAERALAADDAQQYPGAGAAPCRPRSRPGQRGL